MARKEDSHALVKSIFGRYSSHRRYVHRLCFGRSEETIISLLLIEISEGTAIVRGFGRYFGRRRERERGSYTFGLLCLEVKAGKFMSSSNPKKKLKRDEGRGMKKKGGIYAQIIYVLRRPAAIDVMTPQLRKWYGEPFVVRTWISRGPSRRDHGESLSAVLAFEFET
jgi:hypothetical protein